MLDMARSTLYRSGLLGLVTNTTFSVNPPTWSTGPQFSQPGNAPPSVYSLGQDMHGTSSEPSAFGTDSWQDKNSMISPASFRAMPNPTPSFQHLQTNNHHMHGAHQPDWTQAGIVYGPGYSGGNNGNAETDTAIYAADSDESSEMSEQNDNHHLDGQPWESVQMTSVSALEPFDSTDADFLWLDDADEHDEASTQLVRIEKNSNGREFTTQQSRRPFINQALRDETSNTRKLKACVRCRMQKIRVSKAKML